MGPNAVASNTDSKAIGQNADATGVNSIAIGGDDTDVDSADASGSYSVSIGRRSEATKLYSTALGHNSRATGQQGVAIGSDSFALGITSTAVGNASSAIQTNSTAIGSFTYAGGIGSVSLGLSSTSSSAASIAIGQNADAEGVNSIAIGGNSTDTNSANALAADSVAIGNSSQAINVGQHARASGYFTIPGDSQYSRFISRGQTTGSTATNINPDGGTTNQMILSEDTAWMFKIHIVARENATDDAKMWEVSGGVTRDGFDNTSLVGTVTETVVAEDTGAANWDITVSADDTNEALQVSVTGETSKTIRWVAVVNISEVGG